MFPQSTHLETPGPLNFYVQVQTDPLLHSVSMLFPHLKSELLITSTHRMCWSTLHSYIMTLNVDYFKEHRFHLQFGLPGCTTLNQEHMSISFYTYESLCLCIVTGFKYYICRSILQKSDVLAHFSVTIIKLPGHG